MVSTASNVFSYNVTGLDATPTDIRFGEDGRRLYVIGTSNDNPRQLLLGNPYDLTSNVTTGPAPSAFFDDLGETTPQGFYVRPDGKRSYVVGTSRDSLYSIFLGNAWDVSSGEFGFRHFSSASLSYDGLAWSNSGTSIFLQLSGGEILQFKSANTEVPFDLTLIDFSVAKNDIPFNDISLYGSLVGGISFSPDNRYFYAVHTAEDVIRRYEFKDPANPVPSELKNPFKPTTGSNWVHSFDPKDISIIPNDDSNIIIAGVASGSNSITGDAIKTISMPEGNVWNLANIHTNFIETTPFDTSIDSIAFLDGGTKLMMIGGVRRQANILLLSSPYDISTYYGTEGNVISLASTIIGNDLVNGISVNPNGDFLYLTNEESSTIMRVKLNTANSLYNASFTNFLGSGIRTLNEFDTYGSTFGPVAINLNSDGTIFFLCARNYDGLTTVSASKSNVLQMNMPYPYDIGSSTFSGFQFGPLGDYLQFSTLGFQIASNEKSMYMLEYYSSTFRRLHQIYMLPRSEIL
jgi:sugar lactone lactonase YvrE